MIKYSGLLTAGLPFKLSPGPAISPKDQANGGGQPTNTEWAVAGLSPDQAATAVFAWIVRLPVGELNRIDVTRV